ncbi:hypothetical protein JZ751_004716, partial [Albula glossodonta]
TWFRIDEAEAWVTRSGPSYTIAEVSPGESGQYYCEARNRIGAHSSPVLTVRVRGRLKVIALASAVGVSAGLITLTVMVMISKNMHRVDSDPAEEDKQEETEDLYENVHPCIVPLKEAPQSSEADGSLNYVTVHYSRRPGLDQVPATNTPQDGDNEPRKASDVVYTVLARPNHL